MTIKLLGTGAADGVPPMFTANQLGSRSFEPESKDYRTRAAALIDDCLKIDLGPDSLAQNQRFKVDPLLWDAIIYTHSHEDHFTVSELQYALYPFNANEFPPFTIYSNATVKGIIECRYPDWPFEIIQTQLYETIHIGDYAMTPIRAKHTEPEECQNLIFEKDGKRLGYMTDTGWWPDRTWEYLDRLRLDGMVIECTDGFRDSGYDGHLDLIELGRVLDKLRAIGTIDDATKIITTHHSHYGGSHEDLIRGMEPMGISPGYDGIEISI